jgi:hypothetical protein
VQAVVQEVGINVDILEMCVGRIDPFRNIHLKEPCRAYRRAYQQLYRTRTTKTEWESGLNLRNRRYCYSFYEKDLEKQDKARRRGRRYVPVSDHLLRVELQIRKIKTVEKWAGVRTVADLIEKYDTLEGLFREDMRSKLFYHPVSDWIQPGYKAKKSTQSLFKNILRWMGRKGIASSISMEQLKATLAEAGMPGVEELLACVEERDSRYFGNKKHELREAHLREQLCDDPCMAQRYLEIMELLLDEKNYPVQSGVVAAVAECSLRSEEAAAFGALLSEEAQEAEIPDATLAQAGIDDASFDDASPLERTLGAFRETRNILRLMNSPVRARHAGISYAFRNYEAALPAERGLCSNQPLPPDTFRLYTHLVTGAT